MLGLLAVMLAGSVMASTAFAGPFWYHRPIGEVTGNGVKITSQTPENYAGTGGEQTFKGKIGTTEFEIFSKSTQVKGAIFNNALQGQIKLELVFNQPTLLKPVISGCTVTVGQKNIVQVKGHLMWKWNGETKQLEEQKQESQVPDLVFTPSEVERGATTLPKGAFTTITFGSTCGALVGTFNVGGTEVGLPSPAHVGEWSQTLSVRTLEGKELLQHFWNGEKFVGAKVGLELDSNPASLIGQTTTEAKQQEVAVKES
jgi:hypothetical protein